MPELWSRLAVRGKSQRVRELRVGSNLPAARYLYNDVDCDDSEIRELKRALEHLHRSAIAHLLIFMVVATAAASVWLLG